MIRVFADVQAPTVLRSAILGLECTVYPGINEIDDDDFANAMILAGTVLPVPDQPLVTAKNQDGTIVESANHEPHYATQGQGLRGDLEAARKGGVVDRASALAHNRAAAAAEDTDAQLEKERQLAAAKANLVDADDEGVFKAEVRRTAVVGTEAAHRLDLSDEEKNEEIKARALGISKDVQKGLGARRQSMAHGKGSKGSAGKGAASKGSKSKGASPKPKAQASKKAQPKKPAARQRRE